MSKDYTVTVSSQNGQLSMVVNGQTLLGLSAFDLVASTQGYRLTFSEMSEDFVSQMAQRMGLSLDGPPPSSKGSDLRGGYA